MQQLKILSSNSNTNETTISNTTTQHNNKATKKSNQSIFPYIMENKYIACMKG